MWIASVDAPGWDCPDLAQEVLMATRSIDFATPLSREALPNEAADIPPTGRSLVVVAPDSAGRTGWALRHSHAPFIAQLIATSAGVAQTRARRRARPKEATQSYAVVGDYTPRRFASGRIYRAI